MVTTAIHIMAGVDIMITVIGDGITHIQHLYLCIMTITEPRNIAEALTYIGRVPEAQDFMEVTVITEPDQEVA